MIIHQENQIDTEMSYPLIPIRNSNIPKYQERQMLTIIWKIEITYALLSNVKQCRHFGKQNIVLRTWNRLVIWNHQSYYWAYTPKKINRIIQRYTWITMFIQALFKVAKIWKQQRHSSFEELINKPWLIRTMECYSAMEVWHSTIYR